jgi:hypothetical protein
MESGGALKIRNTLSVHTHKGASAGRIERVPRMLVEFSKHLFEIRHVPYFENPKR